MKQRCLKFTYLDQYDVKPYLNTFCLNNFVYEIERNIVKKKFGSSPELLDRELERRPKHEFKRMHTTRRLSANRAK